MNVTISLLQSQNILHSVKRVHFFMNGGGVKRAASCDICTTARTTSLKRRLQADLK